MLKKTITYKNFNDVEITETFYFNLTKAEIIEMEMSADNSLVEKFQNITKTEDGKALIREFKNLILTSYGKKSEDGNRFVKSAEDRMAFEQSAAYDTLFMELTTNENASLEFFIGILPADIQNMAKQEMIKETAKLQVLPPPPPSNS